jgi:dynein heavy chain, axonemal
MFSSEGEYVQFVSLVDTAAARGNVDEWLLEVERRMVECIHGVCQKAYEEYSP